MTYSAGFIKVLCTSDQSYASGKVSSITDEIHIGHIATVIDFINNNYSKDISLEEMTRQAHLSKFHFIRIFKKFTSYSPHQYLLSVRLSHSRELLSSGLYSIGDVADKCGFKRLDYFSALFKKKFHCNPSEYRDTCFVMTKQ